MSGWTRRAFLERAALTAGTHALGRRIGPFRAARPPNVLVICLDTVRRDRFAVDDGRLSPALHRFAARGVTYTRAWSASSWSLPSQASILTGVGANRHGANWPGLALRATTPTLAERLAAHGYVTGAFSSNAAWVTPEYLGRGFLRFRAYSVEDHLRRTTHGRWLSRLSELVGGHPAGRGTPAAVVRDAFLDFVDAYAERPFFGYLCFMDVNREFHHAQLGRAIWEGAADPRDILAAYDAALARLDTQVEAVLAGLAQRGRLDDTLVVITSNHGESFGKAHAGDHDPAGHGTSLFPEQTRVPLMIAGPGIPARTVVDATVSTTGIAPTIYRQLGLASPAGTPGLPLDASTTTGDRPVGATLRYDAHHEQAAMTDRWLYRRNFAAGREELYDLAADPQAQHDLGTSGPALADLRAFCDATLAERAG